MGARGVGFVVCPCSLEGLGLGEVGSVGELLTGAGSVTLSAEQAGCSLWAPLAHPDPLGHPCWGCAGAVLGLCWGFPALLPRLCWVGAQLCLSRARLDSGVPVREGPVPLVTDKAASLYMAAL